MISQKEHMELGLKSLEHIECICLLTRTQYIVLVSSLGQQAHNFFDSIPSEQVSPSSCT